MTILFCREKKKEKKISFSLKTCKTIHYDMVLTKTRSILSAFTLMETWGDTEITPPVKFYINIQMLYKSSSNYINVGRFSYSNL